MKMDFYRLPYEVRAETGSVLIIVLWVIIGLVGMALYFANSMTYELRAADNRTSGQAAEQAIEGAARYVGYILSTYSTNGVMPDSTEFACAAVPVGQAHFWLIGRDPEENSSTDPYFGLVDEGGKLNLNTISSNILQYLPNMTPDFSGAIVDWRSTNTSGEYSLNYSQQGYEDKNDQFETVDELRLVYGATVDLLAGEDINRNGILDANETDANGNGVADAGLLDYTTVYTREPNFHWDTTTLAPTALTNVNTATQEQLRELFQNDGVSSAESLAGQLYSAIHPVPNGNGTLAGMLDFCNRCKQAGMASTDFDKIASDITTSTNIYIRNRVNLNTASSTVLTALFTGLGVDEGTAQGAATTLVNYRAQNPYNVNSLAWVLDALGNTSTVVTTLTRGDYVTTRSFQFIADIAAIGPFGRGYRRVKFVFDTSDGTPKIIYRQDLSRLGWALGENVRQTWVTNPTP
ncbi:MAG TPA: hypothetical protein VL527_15495 [Dongiaceae bacterium]|nr:hypothetical protein [Dongiaceae bacterium]